MPSRKSMRGLALREEESQLSACWSASPSRWTSAGERSAPARERAARPLPRASRDADWRTFGACWALSWFSRVWSRRSPLKHDAGRATRERVDLSLRGLRCEPEERQSRASALAVQRRTAFSRAGSCGPNSRFENVRCSSRQKKARFFRELYKKNPCGRHTHPDPIRSKFVFLCVAGGARGASQRRSQGGLDGLRPHTQQCDFCLK